MSVSREIWAVVATGLDGAIGKGNELPWHLPGDLGRFRRFTTPWPIIMGRRTWESIGRPLPNRRNIVISSTLTGLEGAEVFGTLDAALAATAQSERTMIIGGAALYEAALPLCTHIHHTLVQGTFPDADTFLAIPVADWQAESEEPFAADEKNTWATVVRTLVRRKI
jgi:dihydrofolate reductase